MAASLLTKIKQFFGSIKAATTCLSASPKVLGWLKDTSITRSVTSRIYTSVEEVKDFFTSGYSADKKFPELLRLGMLVVGSSVFRNIMVYIMTTNYILWPLLAIMSTFFWQYYDYLPYPTNLLGYPAACFAGNYLLQQVFFTNPLYPFIAYFALGPAMYLFETGCRILDLLGLLWYMQSLFSAFCIEASPSTSNTVFSSTSQSSIKAEKEPITTVRDPITSVAKDAKPQNADSDFPIFRGPYFTLQSTDELADTSSDAHSEVLGDAGRIPGAFPENADSELNATEITTTGLFAARAQRGEYDSVSGNDEEDDWDAILNAPLQPNELSCIWNRRAEDKKDMLWIATNCALTRNLDLPLDVKSPGFPNPNGEVHYYLLAQTFRMEDIDMFRNYMFENADMLARRYNPNGKFMSCDEEIEMNKLSCGYRFPHEYPPMVLGPKPECFTHINDEDDKGRLYWTARLNFTYRGDGVGDLYVENTIEEPHLVREYDQGGDSFADDGLGRSAAMAVREYQDDWHEHEYSRYLTEVPEWCRPKLQDESHDIWEK